MLEKHKVKNCVNSFWCFLWLAWAFSHSNLSPKMHSATMQAVSRRRSTSKAPWSCPLWAKEIVLCSEKKTVQNPSKKVVEEINQKSVTKNAFCNHAEDAYYELSCSEKNAVQNLSKKNCSRNQPKIFYHKCILQPCRQSAVKDLLVSPLKLPTMS